MKVFGSLVGFVGVGLMLFFAIGFFIPSFDYDTSIVVNRPVQESYDVFLDASLTPLWMIGLKEFKLISGQPNAPGSTYKVVIEEDNDTEEMIQEILVNKPNEQFSYRMTNDYKIIDIDAHFEAVGPRTRIKVKRTVTGKNLLWKSILPVNKENFEKEDQFLLERLKAVIEAQ